MIDFGEAILALGIDLSVLGGVVNHIYESSDDLKVVEPEDGSFRLELDPPALEVRQDPFRMGLHLTGKLFVGDVPDALVFDTWVHLAPAVAEEPDEDGMPVGQLAFVEVEEVTPDVARAQVEAAFQPDGFIGAQLAELTLPVFAGLLENATRQLFAPLEDPDDDDDGDDDEEPPVEVDPSLFSTAFFLGAPTPLRRPVWDVAKVDGEWGPTLDFEFSDLTVPALVATVALAGDDPLPPEAPSVVRPSTGMALVVTQRLLQARLDRQADATEGDEVEGLTVDDLDMAPADFGFTVQGAGHKTGADVTFAGSVVARYTGGTDGALRLLPAIETEVDLDWWAQLLSVVLWFIPGLGWFLNDLLILGPKQEAPGKIEDALLERFGEPLAGIGAEVAAAFSVPDVPTGTFLADLWFFDGNLAVAAVAFAGRQVSDVVSVTKDVAYLAPDPLGAGQHENRRKPVPSVATIRLSSGHVVTPWQAAFLLAAGIVDLPGYHVVDNPAARGGRYLRSDPNETTTDNLLA